MPGLRAGSLGEARRCEGGSTAKRAQIERPRTLAVHDSFPAGNGPGALSPGDRHKVAVFRRLRLRLWLCTGSRHGRLRNRGAGSR